MQQSIPAIVVNYRDNARPSSHYLSTESQCPYTETRPRHSDTTYLQNPSVHTQPQRQGQAIETTLSYRIPVSTHNHRDQARPSGTTYLQNNPSLLQKICFAAAIIVEEKILFLCLKDIFLTLSVCPPKCWHKCFVCDERWNNVNYLYYYNIW